MTAIDARLRVDDTMSDGELAEVTHAWLDAHLPPAWRAAGDRGGVDAVRQVRDRRAYEEWYPVFGASGLVVPTWTVPYGGLGLRSAQARVIETVLAPYHLGRLNILGLNNTASALFEHGTEEQRLRFLPPIVRNEEIWCQLFSEPGAGSDLASLATRAVRDGDEWVLHGQKVWTTWAHLARWGIVLARTDPTASKRKGITYFLLDLRQAGVEIRPLRHMGGTVDFNEVFLDGARVPDFQRVGAAGDGWRVGNSTLAGERQMVAGSGSGGVDRIGGQGTDRLVEIARAQVATTGVRLDAVLRDRLVGCVIEERIRSWTNLRVRAGLKAGRPPGPASSIGKVIQGALNQRVQLVAVEMLGAAALAWPGPESPTPSDGDWAATMPAQLRGMLRSRANTIEGGTTEVNKNILGERVLGLPREPDPWDGRPWEEIPRA